MWILTQDRVFFASHLSNDKIFGIRLDLVCERRMAPRSPPLVRPFSISVARKHRHEIEAMLIAYCDYWVAFVRLSSDAFSRILSNTGLSIASIWDFEGELTCWYDNQPHVTSYYRSWDNVLFEFKDIHNHRVVNAWPLLGAQCLGEISNGELLICLNIHRHFSTCSWRLHLYAPSNALRDEWLYHLTVCAGKRKISKQSFRLADDRLAEWIIRDQNEPVSAEGFFAYQRIYMSALYRSGDQPRSPFVSARSDIFF